MLDPAVPLFFSNNFIKIIKNSYLLYKDGLFYKLGTVLYVKKSTVDIFYFCKKILWHVFNKTGRFILPKSGVVVA